MSKRWLLFLPLVSVLALLLLVLYLLLLRPSETGEQYDPQYMPLALQDKPFPAFSLASLYGEKTLTELDLKGRWNLVNVWATWCVSCRVEHGYLLALKTQGVSIVGLNYKDSGDKAKAWLEKLANPYRFTIEDNSGRLGFDLGVTGAPETYLVDPAGIIRLRHQGVLDKKVWLRKFKPLIKE